MSNRKPDALPAQTDYMFYLHNFSAIVAHTDTVCLIDCMNAIVSFYSYFIIKKNIPATPIHMMLCLHYKAYHLLNFYLVYVMIKNEVKG